MFSSRSFLWPSPKLVEICEETSSSINEIVLLYVLSIFVRTIVLFVRTNKSTYKFSYRVQIRTKFYPKSHKILSDFVQNLVRSIWFNRNTTFDFFQHFLTQFSLYFRATTADCITYSATKHFTLSTHEHRLPMHGFGLALTVSGPIYQCSILFRHS